MKTDRQIQQDVLSELAWDPSINAAHIGVQVDDSIVTLSGKINNLADKWRIEKAARRVHGVKGMAIDLKVEMVGESVRSDSDIAHTAKMVLDWNPALPKNSVEIMVEKGWITLTGQLEWNYQREIAQKVVSHLVGVTGVSNQLAIKASISNVEIKEKITNALLRQSVDEAKKVKVSVNQSEVVLSGMVSNWVSREMIKNAAWMAKGVSSVIDEMRYTE